MELQTEIASQYIVQYFVKNGLKSVQFGFFISIFRSKERFATE